MPEIMKAVTSKTGNDAIKFETGLRLEYFLYFQVLWRTQSCAKKIESVNSKKRPQRHTHQIAIAFAHSYVGEGKGGALKRCTRY